MREPVTILAVDDESLVRTLLRRVLQDQGFKVLEAASGEQAIEILSTFSGQIDLLLTDVRMPGMGGWQLAKQFAQMRPGVPILYMSGYSAEVDHALGSGYPGDGYLDKPFSQKSLLAKILPMLRRPKPVASESRPAEDPAPAEAPAVGSKVASAAAVGSQSRRKPEALSSAPNHSPMEFGPRNPHLSRAAETLLRLEWQVRLRQTS